MSDVDAAPAAEIEIAESAPLSEVLSGDRHERTREVGEVDAPVVAAATAAVADAPVIAAPALPPVVDPATKPEAEQPFWFRQEAKKLRQRAEAAERELQTTRQRGPQPEPQSEDERNRPVTLAEVQYYQQQERMIAKVEYLGEAFSDKHGEETFEELREWLLSKKNPDGTNPMESWALAQRNPWTAAYQQYQREHLASEIGDDPNAWREKERQRLRDEILAEQQAERPAPATAPTMQRPPPPAPASTARAAAPRDDSGRFTGPAPISQVFKHKG